MHFVLYLLENHAKIVARVSLLRSLLRDGYQDGGQPTEDEVILSMVFHENTKDKSPRSKSHKHGSSTEYAALHYNEQLCKELSEHEEQRVVLCNELERLERYLQIYDTAMVALSEKERHFVQAHFDRGLSLSEMTCVKLGGNNPLSLSTLKRMRTRVLAKLSSVFSLDI